MFSVTIYLSLCFSFHLYILPDEGNTGFCYRKLVFLREFDERFLISFNAIAFWGKMLFTDLASFPRPTLIDQVLKPRDP